MNRTPRGGLAAALAAMLWLSTAPLFAVVGHATIDMEECYYPSVDRYGPCGPSGPPGNPFTPPGGVTPPSGTCPDLTQAWFYGFVVDPYARGVANAPLTASGTFNGKSFLNTATTLANGTFAVCVPAGEQTVNLSARGPSSLPNTFEPASVTYTLNAQNPTYPELMLIWTLKVTSVSPQYLQANVATPVTITVTSGINNSETGILVGAASTFPNPASWMSYQSSSGGLTTWTLTTQVSAGAPEAAYSLSLQGAQTANPSLSATYLVQTFYTVTRTPPSIASRTPLPYADTNSGAASATWAAAAPLSAAVASVDGAPVSPIVGPASESIPGTSATGVHYVKTHVVDAAGNQSLDASWLFTVTSPLGSAATASLDPNSQLTLQTNPSSAVPPPASVTFSAAAYRATPWLFSMAASTEVGGGTFSRSISPAGAPSVLFSNGVTQQSVAVQLPLQTFSYSLASVSTAAGALAAHVSGESLSIPSFTVQVPTGYSTPTSTATLQLSQPLTLGAVVPANGSDMFRTGLCASFPMKCTLTLAAIIEACDTTSAGCTTGGQYYDVIARGGSLPLPGCRSDGWCAALWPVSGTPLTGVAETGTGADQVDPGCSVPSNQSAPFGSFCGQLSLVSGQQSYGCAAIPPTPSYPECGQSSLGPWNAAGYSRSGLSSLALGCDTLNSGVAAINLCNPTGTGGGYWLGLFQSRFLYPDQGCSFTSGDTCSPSPNPAHVAAWQQDHAATAWNTANSAGSASCPMEGALNSNSGTVSTVIQRIVENATAGASFTSSAQPGPYVPEALGGPTSTGNAYLGVSTSGPSTIALPYQIYTGTPDFPLPSSPYLAVGAWTDVVTGTQVGNGVSVFGEATVSAASTTVEWPPTGLGNSSTDLEADSGADFDNSGGAELVNVTNQVAALSQVTFNC